MPKNRNNHNNRSRGSRDISKNNNQKHSYNTGCCGMPRIISAFIDPSFLFVAGIMVAPAVVLFTPLNKRGDPHNDNHVTEITNYFLNPVFVCCISLWFLFELLSTVKGTSLTCKNLS